MKAFQLKISLRHLKPPVWRKIIVPAGITFSQLSMILNKAMGWDSSHLFDFKFKESNIYISEDIDEYSYFRNMDSLESATTYIREFLECHKKFKYTYDMGDNWEHNVTVEKILTDYELNYPQVIKFKGNCPPEDCGGVWGYYNFLDALEDEEHPEHEEYMDWSEGFLNSYDIDQVNEDLKNHYFYKWGKGETRNQTAIFHDFFKKKYGLQATKKDKNVFDSISEYNIDELLEAFMQSASAAMLTADDKKQLTLDILDDLKDFEKQLKNNFSEMHHDLFPISTPEMSWKEIYGNDTLENIFEDFTKQQISDIAKSKGMKGISKYKKLELTQKLVNFMLQNDTLEYYFSYLTDKELEAFEKQFQSPEEQIGLNGILLEKLYSACYIGMIYSGMYIVTNDVIEAYRKIQNKEFEQKQKTNSFLLSCLRTSSILHGITPLNVLLDMIKQNENMELTEEELCEKINQIPAEWNEWIIKGNIVHHKNLDQSSILFLKQQQNKKYYIPTLKEIQDMGIYGCLPEEKEVKKLVQYLVKSENLPKPEAECLICNIQNDIMLGTSFEFVIDKLEYTFSDTSINYTAFRFTELLNDLWDNTRMVIYNGYKPSETRKYQKQEPMIAPLAEEHNVINFEKAKKKKIYPNDMCPCGSGKKYKNCCGKNKN